ANTHTKKKNPFQDHPNLNINCINYKGVSALHIAIKKENERLVKLLFSRHDLDFRDAALHAVATGNTELTKTILDAIHAVYPGSEFYGYKESPDYSPDITPLILAAHCGDYQMVRMLIERGHTIEKPHAPTCYCLTCKQQIVEAGSSISRIRLNAYKAVCNPSYICQVTNDPVYYGFALDKELKECALMDKEFRAEYTELGEQVRGFTVSLLSECRNTTEIEMLLKLPWGYTGTHMKVEFPRLQVALDYNQKEFVAHSMVQQVLTTYWLGEFRSWPRLHFPRKVLHVVVRILLLPFICFCLIFIPQLRPVKKLKAPINRYLLSLASFLIFTMSVFLLNHLDTGNFKRGPPHTGLEAIIVIFVLGHIWSTFRQFWVEGAKRFFSVPWHWYDMIMEFLFVLTFMLWSKSFFDAKADRIKKQKPLERKFWSSLDSTLLHEGFFAIATILTFGKLAYYCLQSSRLGPLQVSLGKIFMQIAYFLLFCFIMILCFAIPMTRSYAYYTGMTQTTAEGQSVTQLSSFSTFTNSFSTFFWAMFCMSPVESADVVVENLSSDKKNPVINHHGFTQAVGRALFATYELLMVIALVNILIAILSNTFQKVVDNADVEFKFARTKLWTHFFDESTRVPSPFNLIPSMNMCISCLNYCKALANKTPGAKAKFSFTRCCYIEYEKEGEVDTHAYETLMTNLVQRYFRAQEQD
ncbi:short transient receptor potential channel 4-like, partial [Stegodyphus dumicola]|uniref:short transient receptor potential channel 4-like n=1 Tax=Stegodyphus dumicola TaxID=202533 RepID=UPI0015A91A26